MKIVAPRLVMYRLQQQREDLEFLGLRYRRLHRTGKGAWRFVYRGERYRIECRVTGTVVVYPDGHTFPDEELALSA